MCFCHEMPNKVFVVGVGMTKFEKPGRRESCRCRFGHVILRCQRREPIGAAKEARRAQPSIQLRS